jgi:proton glutamate symport protein
MTNHNTLPEKLWLKILIGMAIGIVIALTLEIPESFAPWIALPGDMFIAILKMVIVPLVLSSVILGVGSAGSLSYLRSMGVRLVPYFILTTAVAITIGLSITSFVQPGLSVDQSLMAPAEAVTKETLSNLTVPDRIMNMVPVNPAEAQLNKNMLQLVILGIIVGIALLTLKTKPTKTFKEVCEFAQDACMLIVSWAMWLAPIAVASLMIQAVGAMGLSALSSMALYVLCVVSGLLCMVVFYMMIVWIVAKRPPLQFLTDIRAAQIVAFSTSSSLATMPVTLSVAEERLKTSNDVHGFVIPLGATINMDGTALYQATVALFLCQIFGIDLTMVETIILVLTTIGASIGTPGLPGVGVIVLATILSSIGVPPEGIGMILGVDRLLDMCRTTINVTGDLTATAVMQHWMHGK